MKKSSIRVLLIDDSEFVRRLVKHEIRAASDLELVAAVSTQALAFEAIQNYQISVIILNAELPNLEGLEVLQQIMIQAPIPVVMFSSIMRGASRMRFEALQLGALDYVHKPTGTNHERIYAAISVLFEKVRQAAKVQVTAHRRLSVAPTQPLRAHHVVCEDCGKKTRIRSIISAGSKILCEHCDSYIPGLANTRICAGKTVCVISVGTVGYSALLEIVPFLRGLQNGMLIIELNDEDNSAEDLAAYLNEISPALVRIPEANEQLESNRVYILPANSYDFDEASGEIRAGSGLIQTLAKIYTKSFIHVLLAGMSLEENVIQQVQAHSGTVLVQDPKTSLQRTELIQALYIGGDDSEIQNIASLTNYLSCQFGI